jgi:hypothetical protein
MHNTVRFNPLKSETLKHIALTPRQDGYSFIPLNELLTEYI